MGGGRGGEGGAKEWLGGGRGGEGRKNRGEWRKRKAGKVRGEWRGRCRFRIETRRKVEG